MLAFVTVGSTRFDALVASIFTEQVLVSFHQKGYTNLVVQCGDSNFELAESVKNGETVTLSRWGVEIGVWRFKNSLEGEFEKADLIISHAGMFTILIFGPPSRRILPWVDLQAREPSWKACEWAS